jgi:hypothetical protein
MSTVVGSAARTNLVVIVMLTITVVLLVSR